MKFSCLEERASKKLCLADVSAELFCSAQRRQKSTAQQRWCSDLSLRPFTCTEGDIHKTLGPEFASEGFKKWPFEMAKQGHFQATLRHIVCSFQVQPEMATHSF